MTATLRKSNRQPAPPAAAKRKYPSGAEKRRQKLEREAAAAAQDASPALLAGDEAITQLAIESIDPHPSNPRKEFDEGELRALADSLKSCGALSPIIVRRAPGARFELIVGERRLRAASLAGWTKIPAMVRALDDDQVLQAQLVENVQRVDLNPMEIAHALRKICRKKGDPKNGARKNVPKVEGVGMTQTEAGELVGMSGARVTTFLRLLDLPDIWQERVAAGELAMNKATILVRHANEPAILARIERDMIENPWAYRTGDDFERNVKLIATDSGRVPKPHGNQKKKPTQRPPRPDAFERPQPSDVGPVRESDAAAPVLCAPATYDIDDVGPDATLDVLAIVAAIAELVDAGDVESVLQAALDRRDELARAAAGDGRVTMAHDGQAPSLAELHHADAARQVEPRSA